MGYVFVASAIGFVGGAALGSVERHRAGAWRVFCTTVAASVALVLFGTVVLLVEVPAWQNGDRWSRSNPDPIFGNVTLTADAAIVHGAAATATGLAIGACTCWARYRRRSGSDASAVTSPDQETGIESK